MRICRYAYRGEFGFGVVDGDGDASTVTPINGHPFAPFQLAGSPLPLADVRLLAPVLPSKVIGLGKNYAEHAAEMQGEVPAEPRIFLKPSTAVIGPREVISYPAQTWEVHHEAELAVIVGRLCRDLPVERAQEAILGYACANDVTARDLQRFDTQPARAKGFDTFCPLGPWITTGIDWSDLAIECTVNGQVRQSSRTSLMERSVPELLAFVSSVMTLLPGDVILTGTPAGVGPIVPGDEVTVHIENLGELTNAVDRRPVMSRTAVDV